LLNVTCDISLALDITLLTVTFVDLPNYDTIVLDAAAAHNSLIIVTESNTQHICAMSCVFLGCTRPSRYWVVEQLYLAFSSADDNQRVRVRTVARFDMIESGVARPNARHTGPGAPRHSFQTHRQVNIPLASAH